MKVQETKTTETSFQIDILLYSSKDYSSGKRE